MHRRSCLEHPYFGTHDQFWLAVSDRFAQILVSNPCWRRHRSLRRAAAADGITTGESMRKRPLQVTLDVREPSVVELTVGDRVQLDRLTRCDDRQVPERHGSLLQPGLTTLALEPGSYFFKTLSDAHLKVVRGGLDTREVTNDPKDPWPPPLQPPMAGKGDELAGETPTFTVS
jgi:hypothetical protein